MSKDIPIAEDGLPEYDLTKPNTPTMPFKGIRWYHDIDRQGTRFVRDTEESFFHRDTLASSKLFTPLAIMDLYSEHKVLTLDDLFDESLSERRVTTTRYPWECVGSYQSKWRVRLEKMHEPWLPQWYETDCYRTHQAFNILKEETRVSGYNTVRHCLDGPCAGQRTNCRDGQSRVFVYDEKDKKQIYEVVDDKTLRFVRTSALKSWLVG